MQGRGKPGGGKKVTRPCGEKAPGKGHWRRAHQKVGGGVKPQFSCVEERQRPKRGGVLNLAGGAGGGSHNQRGDPAGGA